MRDIKFRAWWPGVKEMVYFDNPFIGMDCQENWTMMFKNTQGHVFLGKSEVMQYTGLKDKNGQEIYEGDIVTWGNGNTAVGFGLMYTDNEDLDQNGLGWIVEDCWLNSQCEVVGNIHENPELLEGK